MNFEIEQIFTQIVAFLITLWILKRFAWKPLLNVMEERKRVIQNEFDTIEEQKKELKELTHTYNAKLQEIEGIAKVTLEEAAKRGEEIALEIEQETRERAAMLLQKVQSDMKMEIGQAKKQLKREIINMTLIATEKMIQEKLDPIKHQKLIEDAIEMADFT